MKMNFELSRVNDKIYLHFDYHGGIIKIGITDYTDEIWKLVQSSKWNITKNPNYIFSNKYKKYLHQIIMAYWYELDCCKKMNENNFVIDHIDNDGFNCVSENLVFLKLKRIVSIKAIFMTGFAKRKFLLPRLISLIISKQKNTKLLLDSINILP